MSSATNAVPDPGTDAALALGCRCPVMDNGRGRGWMGQAGLFVYTAGCPVHCPDDASLPPSAKREDGHV